MATLEDFQRIDMRVGRVLSAEKVPGSDKLLKLTVDIGEKQITLAAGIAQHYAAESLVGRNIVVAALEPRTIRGIESQGMLLVADAAQMALLTADKEVPAGTRIR
jgi:methionine--tRNA ligase beta chain